MFENIIEQDAVSQLRDDILNGRDAPSMLFFGPSESGKGSTALELARVLSCEDNSRRLDTASWKCSCPSCERHRYLQHDDLLILGRRSFQPEINACCSVFLRNTNALSSKLLFFRSLRKLQMRFSPVLMEDDPKFGKVVPVLRSFDEKLNDLMAVKTENADFTSLEKLCRSIVKDALTLDTEGISSLIPVGQIRRAVYWCTLAPVGKRKTLIVENAENMRDEACNSLLKLLEEPSASVSIVLTAQRREAIIPTILSRLRPYRFLKRSTEGEKEVLRRIFLVPQEEASESKIYKSVSAYLESFLVQNTEKLYPLAAYFLVSLAQITILSLKKRGVDSIPHFIDDLGKRYAPISESAGFVSLVRDQNGRERSVNSTALVKTLLTSSENFEGDSFSRFLEICLEMLCSIARETGDPQYLTYNDIFKKYTGEAVTAVEVLNQSTTLALEALLYNLKRAFVEEGRN